MTLARRLARRIRDDVIAAWLPLTAAQSKRLGNSLTRLLEGPALKAGIARMDAGWRHELTMDECRARGDATIHQGMPQSGPFDRELRILLSLVDPGYQRPVCRKCGTVTHETKCIWPECPLVDPKARDFIWTEDSKGAAWPPKEAK
jgi:hypothetical protein